MTYSVLIVEDDAMVSSINKRYVERIPEFKVTGVAASVKEAIKLTKKYLFDLLLIDIHLTNESGVDLIKRLRKEEYPADFIMITAINEQETIELCAQYGAVDYILKPFQFDRFQKSMLRFKQQKELLNGQNKMEQADIDQFYWLEKEQEQKHTGVELEKGLTEQTLQLILAVIDSFDQAFTIQELTEKMSLSHVSIRKYIHYLEKNDFLEVEQRYGAVGRPTNFYKKKF